MKICIAIIIFLLISTAAMGYVVYRQWPVNYFTLAILNVGVGSSIYIESPTHHRLLIDGGPAHAVLSEVSRFMPFYDRSLDVVVSTSPGDEFVGGLIDILNTYHVKQFVESGATSSSLYAEVENQVSKLGIPRTLARRGLVLDFGDGLNLTALYPDHDPISTTTYDAGVIAKLSFGPTSAMITTDAPAAFEDYVLAQDGTTTLASEILTTFYESVRDTPSSAFVQAVGPQWTVVSGSSKDQNGTIVFHCSMQDCTKL